MGRKAQYINTHIDGDKEVAVDVEEAALILLVTV